jgi:hypothetical protein
MNVTHGGPIALVLGLALSGCSSASTQLDAGEASATPAKAAPSAVASATTIASSAVTAPVVTADDAPKVDYRALSTELSEPDANFFSDNFVSNETSYLQISSTLVSSVKQGGVYVGVGPEQNFTYLAMTRPKLAFVVDIRRQNLIVHLLYRAAFEEAATRAQFVTLLFGRAYSPDGDPGANATIEQVLTHAEKLSADETSYLAAHKRLRDRIQAFYPLDAVDDKALEGAHRAFFKGQLDLRFELKLVNGRKYPTIRELFAADDPSGKKAGFLASEESFRFVQTMEKDGRVIPLVGDFAGDKALPKLGAYLRDKKLTVSTFYVSNVEQYLLEGGVWPKWRRNVAGLPTDDKSVFIRCYLDQGKKHPAELPGHRTATVVQRVSDFESLQQKQPFKDFFSVSTAGVL